MDRMLFSYKGVKTVLAELAVLTVLQGVSIIAQSYSLADAISSLFGGDSFALAVRQLSIFFFALLFRQLLVVWKKSIAFRFAEKISSEQRKLLIHKLFKLGVPFVSAEGSGSIVTLVQEGIMKFRNYLEILLPKWINMALLPVMVVIFVFFQDVRSGIILIITMPILIGFMILLGVAARSKANRQYQSFQQLSGHFVESLRGLETLKYVGLSQTHIGKIRLISEKYRQATMATLKIAFLSSFALDFFTMLSIATVAVFLGIGLINGTILLKPALTVLILAPEYFLPVRELGSDFHATLDGKEAGKKVQEILTLKVPKQPRMEFPVWQADQTIFLEDVGVKYQDNQSQSLENISLTISGLKKIGIIGASGSGKTTLVNLLSGFLDPASGDIKVNGKKVTSLNQQGWQKQITYIPQKPYVFHDTVMNNIRFYCPEATEKEVEAAVQKAGLSKVIEQLPEGLATVIGEGGRELSGGQEQRIAIARAFLCNRPILILDEPTAHLDIETEAELKDTMLQLFTGKLVLFATHRLHWMPQMDQIIVLDDGKIVEMGSHQELIDNHGAYWRIVKRQMEEIR